jgi:hypothetical protein
MDYLRGPLDYLRIYFLHVLYTYLTLYILGVGSRFAEFYVTRNMT